MQAVRAEGKRGHGGGRPVVGDILDDGEARAAIGAIDERVEIAAIAGVEQFPLTIRTDGDIGADGLESTSEGSGFPDLKGVVEVLTG